MITGEIKNKLDRLWDAMWSNQMTNPWIDIQQITYLIFIKMLDDIKELLTDTTELDDKIVKLQAELEIISELVSKMVRENSIKAQNQAEYETKYNELAQHCVILRVRRYAWDYHIISYGNCS